MRFRYLLLPFLALSLVGCSARPTEPAPTAAPSTPGGGADAAELTRPDDLRRSDAQGQVTVDVLPLNLDNPGPMLQFQVTLNTHSVDLSMDLAALSTLSTDTGLSVAAVTWDAPRGGHHVQGILTFPAQVGGVPLLEGATRLTLTLRDLDVPERVFEWNPRE